MNDYKSRYNFSLERIKVKDELIKALEDEVKELKDFVDSFDWVIWGNHALTGTCTRLTDDQIKLLESERAKIK